MRGVARMYVIDEQEVEAVRRVIQSGQLFRYRGGEGGETDQFEQELADKIGVNHTVAVTSGTAALVCGLVGMGIGPGDEVIVPAYTFMATALAPLAVGAVPIIAEIDESLTLDPEDVARKITPRTKALIPVDMNGLPSNMDALMELAAAHRLKVIEDACQAVGGSYKGRRLGSIGHAGALSFNHFKIITCGEGGALLTDDKLTYHRALVYHDGGCAFRDHPEQLLTPFYAGSNFRMNEILGAILRVQLRRLDGILEALRAEKDMMTRELAGERSFTLNPVHDAGGDCGTTLAMLFDCPERTRAVVDTLSERQVAVSTPIDSGRHVYSNWEPVMKQRGAHHPRLDGFRLAAAPVSYSPDMCPNTLSILARTACVSTSIDRSEADLRDLIALIKRVAASA